MPSKAIRPSQRFCAKWHGVYLLLGGLLAGCVHNQTGPAHLYTLSDSAYHQSAIGNQTGAVYVDIAPIQMPARFKRPQLVINIANSKEIRILEQARWASSFNDEFRDALKSAISQDGRATVSTRLAGQAPAYRVALSITQLSAIPNDKISADVALTIAPLVDATEQSQQPLVCQINLQQPVSAGTVALVAGYQSLVDKLARYIMQNISKLSVATAAVCDSTPS